jgi:hypothetical protein
MMKKISFAVFAFLMVAPALIGVEPLSKIGKVDEDALKSIQGEWVIEGSRSVLRYSMDFACLIDGLKYFYYYRVGTNPSYPFVYTIVKSVKTGRYYFARGYYKDGRLYGSTSRMEFENTYLIVVYSDTNPDKIYFKAFRVQKTKDGYLRR